MDRKTVIAFAVIILIFLLLPYYYRIVSPPKPAPDSTAVQNLAGNADSTLAQSPEAPPQNAVREAVDSLSILADSAGFLSAAPPQDITVKTPLYEMTFSTKGAVLTGFRLLQYAGQNEGLVQLIRPGSRDNLNLVLFKDGRPVDLKDVRFNCEPNALNLSDEQTGRLVFTARTADGASLEKSFAFSADSYLCGLDLRGEKLGSFDPYYELHWGSGMAITETDTAQDLYYFKAYALMGTEVEKFDGKGDRTLKGGAEGETHWVAQRSKYFEVALLPKTEPANGVLFGIEQQPLLGLYRPKIFSMALRLKGSLDEEGRQFNLYCGPVDQKLLKQVHPKLESTMNWGLPIIAPFSKSILWLLKTLHKIIPNYGLVLILFSIIVKVVIWPLTQKSTRSMSKMSALQPKMKELQEKFKATPDRLNKAMMQLYKDQGVNPFSGCWPVLLQMPLLYALFIVFRSTIELRKAPFILWIHDLSMPDIVAELPFRLPMYGSHMAILPLVMGCTQILMSRTMVTDPKQKFTVYFMPIFMVLIFNTLPSGLNLYYALFNLWTWLQQSALKKRGFIPSAGALKA